MAIAVDAVSSAYVASSVTSISWSHTLASDADCLYVALSIDGGGGTYSYNATCTANGTSMTRVHEGNTNQYLAVFRLLAPTTGTITIAASWTGAHFPASAALSLKGVQQTTPEGAVSSSTNASGSSYSHTITSATGDMVLTFGSINNTVTSITATGSATSQVQSNTNGAGGTLVAIASAAGGASITVGHSWSSANRYSGASFNVAAVGGTTYNDTISDPLTAADSLLATISFGATLADSWTLAESLAAAVTFSAELADSVYPGDIGDPAVAAVTFEAPLTDATSTNDSLACVMAFEAPFSDALTAADSLAYTLVFGAALTDSVSAAESFGVVATFAASTSETVTVAESFIGGLVFTSTITDGGTVGEGFNDSLTLFAQAAFTMLQVTVVVGRIELISGGPDATFTNLTEQQSRV